MQPNLGLKPENKINTPSAFGAFRAKVDYYVSSPEVKIMLLANKLSIYRVGTILPKRVLKSACKRNKMRRVFKETMRLHQELLRGYDILLIIRNGVTKLKPESYQILLKKQWNKIEQWLKKS